MFKVLENGKMPTRGSKYSAYVDLYASEDVVIGAGETAIVCLGVCIDFYNFWKDYVNTNLFDKSSHQQNNFKHHFLGKHYLQLNPRSSLRAKGLISNTGIIDLDYEDEIKIIIHNPICGVYQDFCDGFELDEIKLLDTHNYNAANNEVRFTIKKGDRIAQITLLEHKSYLFDIQSYDIRDGGFGSTDKS